MSTSLCETPTQTRWNLGQRRMIPSGDAGGSVGGGLRSPILLDLNQWLEVVLIFALQLIDTDGTLLCRSLSFSKWQDHNYPALD